MDYALGPGGQVVTGEDSPALFTCFTGWSSPPDHPPRRVSWTVGVLEYWSILFNKFEWDITVRDLLARWRENRLSRDARGLFCEGRIGETFKGETPAHASRN